MDKYGFLLDDDRCLASRESADIAHSDASTNSETRREYEKKWENILDGVPSHRSNAASADATYSATRSKMKYYARRGLPDSLRRKAWTVLTGVKEIMTEKPEEYYELVGKAEGVWTSTNHGPEGDKDHGSSLEESIATADTKPLGDTTTRSSRARSILETIERDILRTFPKHVLFHGGHDGDVNPGENESIKLDSRFQGEGANEGEIEGSCEDPSVNPSASKGVIDIDAVDNVDPAEQDMKLNDSKSLCFDESMGTLMSSMTHNMSFRDGTGSAAKAIPERQPSTADGGSCFSASGRGLDINQESQGRRLSTRSAGSKASGGDGQGALRRVLHAYSIYDPGVGYCQGMNFISAMFLTLLSEEEAFWLLVVVMNEDPFKLRNLFVEDMVGTQEVLYIAEKLLAQFLPKLSKNMEEKGVHVSMFVTQWLMTVYTSTFPFDLVVRVWDCFLIEGWKAVYRVMLLLLDHASKDVLDLDFEEMLDYFRNYPSKVNGQMIMSGSFKIALKTKHVERHLNEFRKTAGSWKKKRRTSVASSASFKISPTEKLLGQDAPKETVTGHNVSKRSVAKFSLRLPQILPKNTHSPKEIIVENLTDKLLPIIGASKFAVMLHNVLTSEECTMLINQAEEHGFQDASIYDRQTHQTHRSCGQCTANDPGLANFWYERIMRALEGTIYEKKLLNVPWVVDPGNTSDAFRAIGLNKRLHLFRYEQGHFSLSHDDSEIVSTPNQVPFVSAIVHLNGGKGFKGGKTVFRDGWRHLDIKPQAGSVLLFERDILCEERLVTQGKKYIIRTNVMYEANEETPKLRQIHEGMTNESAHS